MSNELMKQGIYTPEEQAEADRRAAEKQDFHGDEAGEVLIKKLGSDEWVKIKDLAAQHAQDERSNYIIDREMSEDCGGTFHIQYPTFEAYQVAKAAGLRERHG